MNRTTTLSETVHDTILERATEDTGVLEQGKINVNVPITAVLVLAAQSGCSTSGENDPYLQILW